MTVRYVILIGETGVLWLDNSWIKPDLIPQPQDGDGSAQATQTSDLDVDLTAQAWDGILGKFTQDERATARLRRIGESGR